jgi:hypothetical protein
MRADQNIPYEAHLCSDYFDQMDYGRRDEEYEASKVADEEAEGSEMFVWGDWRPESERVEDQ